MKLKMQTKRKKYTKQCRSQPSSGQVQDYCDRECAVKYSLGITTHDCDGQGNHVQSCGAYVYAANARNRVYLKNFFFFLIVFCIRRFF